jgi:hypothetical protein
LKETQGSEELVCRHYLFGVLWVLFILINCNTLNQSSTLLCLINWSSRCSTIHNKA